MSLASGSSQISGRSQTGRSWEEPVGALGMERKIKLALGLMAGIILLLVAYSVFEPARQAQAVKRQEAIAIERGAQRYATLCYTCHGADGTGAVVPGKDPPVAAPPLNRADFRPTDPDEAKKVYDTIFKTISRGRPGTPMPAWGQSDGGVLLNEHIHELTTMIMRGDWTEIKSVVDEHIAAGSPTPIPLISLALAPGVPPGQRVFVEKACIACHTLSSVPGARGTVGPALDGVGSRAAERGGATGRNLTGEAYLRESILDPNAYVVPGFQPVMPSFAGQLTDQQLKDLVDFLLQQK